MLNGIFSTLNGKFLNERRLEIVVNNIANSLTPGYKASRPVLNAPEQVVPEESNQLQPIYASISDSYIHFSDAPLAETGGKLDLAIEGNGFFAVSTGNNGLMYTRNGQFTLNKEKKLVTQDGNIVLGVSGSEITIDGKDVAIETDGSIFVDRVLRDKIKVVDFKEKKGLKNFGKSLFVNTDKANVEITPEKFAVRQGFYETSNVDIMKEMVEMITVLRAYESYSKVDQFLSENLSKLMEVGRI